MSHATRSPTESARIARIMAPSAPVKTAKAAPKAKAPPKPSAAVARPSKPTYRAMVLEALSDLKEPNGSTRPAIIKCMMEKWTILDTSAAVSK